MRPTKLKLLLSAGCLLICCSVSAQADPLVFSNTVALQNGGSTRVDLFSNAGTTLVGRRVDFLVDLNGTLPPGIDTLVLTFSESGQSAQQQQFRIPLFEGLTLPYTQLFSFTLQNPSFNPVDVLLRVDILGSNPDFIIPGGPQAGQAVDSYTYSFRVAQPVPEPASLLLGGMGLGALLARRRRKSLR